MKLCLLHGMLLCCLLLLLLLLHELAVVLLQDGQLLLRGIGLQGHALLRVELIHELLHHHLLLRRRQG